MSVADDVVAPPEPALAPVPLPPSHSGPTPGGVWLPTPAGALVVDAGMDADAAEEALAHIRGTGTQVAAVAWTGPDQGMGLRTPEHALAVPAAAAGAGTVLPGGARTYRVGEQAALVWHPELGVLAAGELLAPGAPLLEDLTPRQARAALHRLADLPLRTAMGAYSTRWDGPDAVRELRSRAVYLEVLGEIARSGITGCLRPRQAAAAAWQRGTLATWAGAGPARHLINIHAAYAAAAGRSFDGDAREAARADARALGAT